MAEPAVRDRRRSASTSRGRASREPVERALAQVEAALEPFGARPHWGKLFLRSPAQLYERRADFLALAERLDPRGAFRNAWLERALDAGPA